MMTFFDTEKVKKIISEIDFLDFIKTECGVNIYKHHNTFFATCPFCHQDMSFILNDKNKTYSCFSCGKGGNIVDLIMSTKNLSFIQTIKFLSKKTGIPTESPIFDEKTEVSEHRKTLFEINQKAAKFYFDILRSDEGKKGMRYFDNRGVTPYIKSTFGLGYGGSFGDQLYQYLHNQGYKDSDLIESGLVGKAKTPYGNNKLFYDKYCNRVIFPILNKDGKVVGIGGRILGDDKPKYLNSPETAVFSKRENLFCYYAAKDSKLPYYIICEGYMDAMSLHQYGFDSAVASLGTALTREQIKMLSNKKEIILAYDSDDAGVRAAKRAIELCKEVGLHVSVLRLPHTEGVKDPDEFLKKFGADEFRKLLENTETSQHFLIRNSKINNRFNYDEAVNELV